MDARSSVGQTSGSQDLLYQIVLSAAVLLQVHDPSADCPS